MTLRKLAHGEATRFIHHSSESHWMCLHISVFCVHHVMCIYLSIPPLPTGTLQRVNPSLPACFATARQLFITSSWLASELCPTVSNCYTGKPKYSLLTPTHTDTFKQMEARRRRGRQRIYFSLFLSWTCVTMAVDHPVWMGDGGQIRRYQTESRHCEHCDHERKPDLCWSSFILYLLQVSR